MAYDLLVQVAYRIVNVITTKLNVHTTEKGLKRKAQKVLTQYISVTLRFIPG